VRKHSYLENDIRGDDEQHPQKIAKLMNLQFLWALLRQFAVVNYRK
jgi:hypothetical protein